MANQHFQHREGGSISAGKSRYRRLVENSRNLICEHGMDGSIHYISPSATGVLGFKPEELSGQCIFDYLHPSDRKNFKTQFKKSINKSIIISKHRLLTKSGAYKWFETQLYPLHNNGHKILQASYRDISERMISEEKEAKAVRSFDAIFDNISVGHALIATDGGYIRANKVWAATLGYTVDEILKLNDMDITHPADREIHNDNIERIRAGEPAKFIKRYVAKKGNVVWADISFAPLLDSQGALESVIACLVHISYQKSHENTILESERNYRLIAENISDVITKHDLDGHLNYVSQAIVNLLGYEPHELVGTLPYDLMHPADVPQVRKLHEQLLSGNEKVTFIFRMRVKSGDYIWVESIGRLVDDRSSMLFVTRDITQRMLHEEKLRKNEKTLKIQNKELLKINEELDRFAYRTSHDLRAPLTSILGLIQVISSTSSDHQKEEYLELIRKSALKLDSFVKEILKFSRNSRLKVENQKINFYELINDVFEDLQFASNIRDMHKIVDIQTTSEFRSDIYRLRIILNNLISNALRYKKDYDEVKIEIRIKCDEKHAMIVFRDHGIGISAEHIDKIFDMFYRATDKNVGSGLGLYIVKETVAKLKGKISVRSELEVGTEFTLKIPNLKPPA